VSKCADKNIRKNEFLKGFEMAFLEKLARFGFDNIIEVADGDTQSVVFRANKGQAKLKAIALEFYRKVQEIRKDTKLTPEGHTDKIKKAAREAIAKLDEARSLFLEVVEKRVSELEKEFRIATDSDENDVTSTMREIEVRGMLQSLDVSKRSNIFLQAIEKFDEVTFRDFVNAPSFLNLLNPKMLENGKQVWAERINPKIARELNEASNACAILSYHFGQVYQGIGELGQIIDDSMRARLQGLAKKGLERA
jgi:hypothetical protein